MPQQVNVARFLRQQLTRTAVTKHTLLRAKSADAPTGLSFELFKEAAGLLSIIPSLYLGRMVFQRDQAICAGLLVRIVKFMTAIVQLIATPRPRHAGRRDVVLALIRPVMESSVNCVLLCRARDSERFDRFVAAGLGAERELHDQIQANVQARGGDTLPIESRMLKSIQRIIRASGLKIEDIKPGHTEWGGTFRDRVKEWRGDDKGYVALFRIPSHAVHGTWADLLFHHLEVVEGGYKAQLKWADIDPRYLGLPALLALEAGLSYLDRFFPPRLPARRALERRSHDLMSRILRIEHDHEARLLREKNRQAEK